MTYLSVCSGIEAATVAWHPLGFAPAAFAEIEKFPCAVLEAHYPDVPNWGDLTAFKGWPNADIDLLVGGTPCQSFSVAGLREGLDDPRGQLTLTYLAVARKYRPTWLVWENVPGVLSADDGRAFGSLLGGLAELGYGFAYRVLDAQYFGLAQRRKRVFVVGHLGDWRRAAAVLFERESLSGHPAPRRETGQDAAPCLGAGPVSGGRTYGTDADSVTSLVAHSLKADGFDASEDGTGRGTPLIVDELAQTLTTGGNGERGWNDPTNATLIPIDMRQASRGEKITNNRSQGSGGPPGHGVGESGDPAFTVTDRVQAIAFSSKDHGADAGDLAPTLRSGGFNKSHANGGVMPAIAHALDSFSAGRATEDGTGRGCPLTPSAMQVRRLTPRECERLQGFPEIFHRVTVDICEDENSDSAQSAQLRSTLRSPEASERAAVVVRIDLERQVLQLLNRGRSVFAVSTAAGSDSFLHQAPIAVFAQLAADTLTTLEPITRSGAEVSHPNTQHSSRLLRGSGFVQVSGREISEHANDAAKFTGAESRCLKFITSRVGRDSDGYARHLQTWCSYVGAAISSSIQGGTRAARSFVIEAHHGYTLIPYRGKPAADGPRYKALGNSMAVPVMRWLGERIAMVEAL